VKIAVRPADLAEDRETIIQLILRFLTPHSSQARYDWLYLNNPHGRAQAWIAETVEDRHLVGMAAAFPRRIWVGGHARNGWVLGDFCIVDRFRSLGPALLLQRACLAEIDAGTVDLCYDFPSRGMLAIYQRLGVSGATQLVRFAKPIRVDRWVRTRVPVSSLANGLIAVGNIALRWIDGSGSRRHGGYSFEFFEGPFGDEFDMLESEMATREAVQAERSAAYLNWRYRDHPFVLHECLLARRNGRLSACVVFTRAGAEATIVDCFGDADEAIYRALLTHLTAFFRERGVETVSAPLSVHHPSRSTFERLGFRARESVPVVIHFSPHLRQTVAHLPEGLRLMAGDRDS
jgi:hypothetical protein